MGFSKIAGRLTSRIGRPVRFSPPRDVHARGGPATQGIIVDEVWADPSINETAARSLESGDDWGDYSFASQLIRWEDDRYTIRLVYYRRRAGEDHWEFASQMTVNGEPNIMKHLFELTLAKREWFSDSPRIS